MSVNSDRTIRIRCGVGYFIIIFIKKKKKERTLHTMDLILQPSSQQAFPRTWNHIVLPLKSTNFYYLKKKKIILNLMLVMLVNFSSFTKR